jgi:hypothetical protein
VSHARRAVVAFLLALGSLAVGLIASARTASADEEEPLVPYPPPTPKVQAPEALAFTYVEAQPFLSLPWIGLQLLPSPEMAFGVTHFTLPDSTRLHPDIATSHRDAFGLRWQVTPLLWSWGTNRRISRWRYLVVDPLARHSGSLELSGNFEYIFGYVDRLLVRPGVRAYFPIAQRGEYLSVSLGTSTYVYDDKPRVAYEVGAYFLFGLFGVQATIAPDHAALGTIVTFRIRNF